MLVMANTNVYAASEAKIKSVMSRPNAKEREVLLSHQNKSVVRLSRSHNGTEKIIEAEVFALMETTCEQALETYHQLDMMDDKIALGPFHPMADFSYSEQEKRLSFHTSILSIDTNVLMDFELPSHEGTYPFKVIEGDFKDSHGTLEIMDMGSYHCYVHVNYSLKSNFFIETLIPLIEKFGVSTVNNFIQWPVQEQKWTQTEKNKQLSECKNWQ